MMIQNFQKQSEQVVGEQFIGVFHTSSWNIAQDTYGGDEEGHGWFLEMTNDARDDSSLHDQLYLALIRVRMVRNGPATVSNDLLIVQLALRDGMTQNRYRVTHHLVFWKRASFAQIRKSPIGVLY